MSTTHEVTTGNRNPYESALVEIAPGADVFDALVQCGLLWGVTRTQVLAPVGDGLDPIVMPGKSALLRDMGPVEAPIPLAVVSSGYQVIQNLDAFSPLQSLVDAGRISLAQGGVTKSGRHCFLLAEISGGLSMLDVDPHERYIIARTSHDGTGSLAIQPWSQRLFCLNQIPAIVRSKGSIVSIHHDRRAETRIAALEGMLDGLVTGLDEFDEEWRRLAGTPVTPGIQQAFVERLFPMPKGFEVTTRQRDHVTRRRAEVRSMATDHSTNANLRGSRAALVAAATEWDQHVRGDARRRSVRLLEGQSSDFARHAFAVAGGL
jgi:phage/plasmid-like protein (TIGR03299 family)